jgi:hypothetical protein
MTGTLASAGILAAMAAIGLGAAQGALAAPTTPEIDLKVRIVVSTEPVRAGGQSEAVVTLTPPAGIHLNQYPPIRLSLDDSPPVIFPEREIKVGLDKMPENPEDNPFHRVDPIRVKFRVDRHDADQKIQVRGKLKYTYCVAKSGYCAPGVKDLAFTVPVTAGP